VEEFVFVVFFICSDVNSGALFPRRSTAHREVQRVSLVSGFIFGYFVGLFMFLLSTYPFGMMDVKPESINNNQSL
jgi:uncharacterized protein YqgC (DUF456 family)